MCVHKHRENGTRNRDWEREKTQQEPKFFYLHSVRWTRKHAVYPFRICASTLQWLWTGHAFSIVFPVRNEYSTLSLSLSCRFRSFFCSFTPAPRLFHSNETMSLLNSTNLSNWMWCICDCRLNRLQTAWTASTENRDRAIFKSVLVIAYEMDISDVCRNRRYLHCIVHWH